MKLDYRYPHEPKYDELGQLQNQATLQQYKRHYEGLSHWNNGVYQDALKRHAQLIELAKVLYGDRSKEVKYLNQHKPEKPVDIAKRWNKLLRRFEQWRVDERKRESSRSSYQRRKAREDAAMAYLETVGKVRGMDFDRYDCLKKAEVLRQQVEIAAGVIGGHLAQMQEVEAVG